MTFGNGLPFGESPPGPSSRFFASSRLSLAVRAVFDPPRNRTQSIDVAAHADRGRPAGGVLDQRVDDAVPGLDADLHNGQALGDVLDQLDTSDAC